MKEKRKRHHKDIPRSTEDLQEIRPISQKLRSILYIMAIPLLRLAAAEALRYHCSTFAEHTENSRNLMVGFSNSM